MATVQKERNDKRYQPMINPTWNSQDHLLDRERVLRTGLGDHDREIVSQTHPAKTQPQAQPKLSR